MGFFLRHERHHSLCTIQQVGDVFLRGGAAIPTVTEGIECNQEESNQKENYKVCKVAKLVLLKQLYAFTNKIKLIFLLKFADFNNRLRYLGHNRVNISTRIQFAT